jgi:MFS family permease
MPWRQRLYLAACVAGITAGNLSFALIAPFFPLEAPQLGLSQPQIAAVFAVMSVGQLVASPAAGPLATALGRRRVLGAGAAMLALGGTCFGAGAALSRASYGSRGLVMAWLVVCRVLQGVGSALMVTMLFALLADGFPNDKGKVMGLAEMAGGLGWSIAPVLGGLLYEAGGFVLPFALLGPLPLFTLAAILLLMPPSLNVTPPPKGEGDDPGGEVDGCAPVRLWRLLTASLLVSACLAMVPFTGWAVFDFGFTVWLTTGYRMTIVSATFYFSVIPVGYAVTTIPIGWLTDKISGGKKAMIVAGLFATGAVYCLFGVLGATMQAGSGEAAVAIGAL